MPKKKANNREGKFRECPACYGPIDYFNSCRHCGRRWTPELSEIEKKELELAREKRDSGEPLEEEQVVQLSAREAALQRDKEEILGKKAKLVGTKSKDTPASFKEWQIHDGDDDTEISRKRSLMRLDSRKIYNQMGLVMRAYQNQKGVILWLTRLWEYLDEAERDEFAPTADLLKKGMMGLAEFSAKKVELAAQMEEALLKEQRKVRTVRAAKSAIDTAARAKRATKLTTPGADSEGFETVDMADLDPEELLEQVRIQLSLKSKKKQSRFEQEVEENEEN